MVEQITDTSVAEAMDRVLEAERSASEAIAAAQSEAEASLQAARETRRQLLETARQRASRVHVRAERRLAAALAELAARGHGGSAERASLEAIAEQAIDRLARRLTSADHEQT